MARDNSKLVTIPGELHSVATGNIVAAAEEVFDYTANKYQKDINQEVDSSIQELRSTINTQVGYYTCSTAGNTTAKVIDASGYTLLKGGGLRVNFTEKNTAANATLNINGTGAKALYYNGVRVSTNNSWYAGEIATLFYDGTAFQLNSLPDLDEYDVSARNGGQAFTFDEAVALVPEAYRHGGLKLRFIYNSDSSISDNKYVQYRLMVDEWSNTITDWQGVDDEPTAGSDNLVKSGGVQNAVEAAVGVLEDELENGNVMPLYAETLEPWADQKAIATPDTYTDAVRTTGGDIPVETSAGSKLESIVPIRKWTAKMLFNGSYNMLNAAKWGSENSQPYVGGIGNDFVYFLVPELTLGTFGTADENNGLLFTDSDGVNVQPASVYFKPLGSTIPQSLTDGISIVPTTVIYDGGTYNDYTTDDAGWMIVPKTIYDNDVCAHIAWEDWYDKHVSLNEPTTNPEAVIGALQLEEFLALIQSDKYLRAVNETVNDHIIFGETSATGVKMVGELSVAANAWTNAATGESDSQGNALYRHSTTVSGIKQGGAASLSDGTPMSIVGTTASYVDANVTADSSIVYYELPTTTTIEKDYTDSVFSGSIIDTATGILPINDCAIEAQVAMDGEAYITVKYAKNIVDQVAINATVDVPQIKKQVEEHEERITSLEDTAVRTGSYDATVAVGLADNLKGDTVVDSEFYKRKTGGIQSVGSGIAAIKEIRGKSIVWNQLVDTDTAEVDTINGRKYLTKINGVKSIITSTGTAITINDATTDQVFDLTIMTLPNVSVAEFEKRFPLDYYDYNAGTIIPFAGQNLVTIGKNQYNPATGKANLLGSLQYQIGGTFTSATIDGVAVTLDSNNCFTTTKDCVLDVTGGNDTDTIVALYNGEDNTYEPYEKHTLPLDPSQWRDKQGNLVFPYGGMHGYGTAYDYAKVDADGYIRKAVRVMAVDNILNIVNFLSACRGGNPGTNGWGGTNTIGFYVSNNNISSKIMRSNATHKLVGFSIAPWGVYGNDNPYIDSFSNDYYAIRVPRADLVPYGYNNSSESSNTAAFKAYLQDKNLQMVYQLATPVEVELATPIYAKYLVDKDGTEEITPANGTKPYTAPANLSILYAMDARGEIKNLPKNYLSKESAENMLNAMVSAGVIQSYTMTYDAANARYQFTFVKAEQASTNAVNNESNI